MNTEGGSGPGTPRARLRWYHFSLVGRTRMAETLVSAVLASPTTTDEAKIAAEYVGRALGDLRAALKERKGC